MGWSWLVVCLVAGCGRFDFDARRDAGTGDGAGGQTDAPWQTSRTFGATSLGSKQAPQSPDAARFARWQLTDEALVTAIAVSVVGNGTANTQAMVGVIYSDNAGEPDMLLARSTELVFSTTNVTPQFIELTLSAPVRLHPGFYWIGDHTGQSGNSSFTYDDLVGAGRRPVDTYADGTAPIAGPDIPSDWQYAFYARYLTAP